MTGKPVDGPVARRSFWAAAAFYVVIGFEFLYMAGPFAAYFYSIYRPGLAFFNDTPGLSWLTRFFMPHIAVETSSPFINWHNEAGAFLAVVGFAAFLLGAGQVYYHKLAKKGAVTGGVYRFIRHPQYTSFVVCGLGLLLLWPRYLVLVMLITMLFFYYWLARVEERECEEKYGQSYREYRDRTSMFLPFFPSLKWLPDGGWKRAGVLASLYAATLVGGLTGARIIESHSIDSLYSYLTADSLAISVARLESGELKGVVDRAASNEEVKKRIAAKGAHYLIYVLPAEWYVSEVPMEEREGLYHSQPADYDRRLYKVIFTLASLRSQGYEGPAGFLRQVEGLTPVAEVWVDTARNVVVAVKGPPRGLRYGGTPVAIY